MGASDNNRDAAVQELNFRSWFDRSVDGVVMADAASRALRYANPAAAQFLGYTSAELTTMTLGDLFPTELVHRSRADFDALLTGTQTLAQNVACLRKNGAYVYADVTANALTVDGRAMVAGFFRDVMPRHEAEQALASSERRYRRLFESARDGILILDAGSGTIVDANPYLCLLMGYEREDFIGHQLWDLGPFKNVEAARTSFADLESRGYVRHEHLPLEAKDGRTIDVEFISNVYYVDAERVIQCNIRDISERRRKDESLRMLERAVNAVSQGIVITGAAHDEHPVLYVSPGFERMSGLAADHLVGKPAVTLQPGADTSAGRALREALQAGVPCTVEFLNQHPDGTAFWNQLAMTPVFDDGGRAAGHVEIHTDISERRTLQQQVLQAQKMEAIGRFAIGVAHDFNNVLSVVLSYAELMLDRDDLDDTVRVELDEIRRASLRGAELTRSLLAFARRQILHQRVIDMNDSARGMEKMLQRVAGPDVALTVRPAPAAWHIKADEGQLEQVIMNLFLNAQDALPHGGSINISVENVPAHAALAPSATANVASPSGPAHVRSIGAWPDVAPVDTVLLTVADTGAGMDEATLARVFEPFFTTKEVGKGTGLGMSVVFGVVQQSGGTLQIFSAAPGGTQVRIGFPRVVGPVEPRAKTPRASERLALRATVLVVEDDEAVRSVMRNTLAVAGLTVLVARDGADAVQVAAAYGGVIDLLLADVFMPRMGGPALAETLGRLRPSMKVLLISALPDEHAHKSPGLQPMQLQKPVSPSALVQAVRDALEPPRGQGDG